jgi:hypothetical protein
MSRVEAGTLESLGEPFHYDEATASEEKYVASRRAAEATDEAPEEAQKDLKPRWAR